jgi:hypothetical protein
MGEVYRSKDIKLKREVCAERFARFLRPATRNAWRAFRREAEASPL